MRRSGTDSHLSLGCAKSPLRTGTAACPTSTLRTYMPSASSRCGAWSRNASSEGGFSSRLLRGRHVVAIGCGVITTLEDPTLRGIGSADVGLVHLGVGLYGVNTDLSLLVSRVSRAHESLASRTGARPSRRRVRTGASG